VTLPTVGGLGGGTEPESGDAVVAQ
jgi:hypothetical protein